jgi:hypothetical protein
MSRQGDGNAQGGGERSSNRNLFHVISCGFKKPAVGSGSYYYAEVVPAFVA